MAGRIPQSFINDLLSRVDIVDVIESRMTLKKTGKNYSGLCPFHDEKTPSFTVSPDKQFYHCFGCQANGTALTFIMNFERVEFVEAVEILAGSLGLEVPREQTGRPRPKVDADLYDVLREAERFYRQSLRGADTAINYLKSRGLTGEVARDFGIGYAPPGWQNLSEQLKNVPAAKLLAAGLQIKSEKGRVYDRFRERIMFPIRDSRGRVIGFGGRTLKNEDGPKYLNSPETEVFHKGSELYGLYEARRALRRIDRLLVVEGYMDVVALAQHGVANAVATLGTASGESHFHKLYRYTDEVICCFDGDSAGRQAGWKALENALPTLNEHRQLKLVFLPDGEDPDSLIRARGKAGFDALVAEATPGLEFLFTRLSQGLDLGTVDGRARLAGLIAPYVEKVPEGVLKTLLQQKVAEVTGLGRRAQPNPSQRIRSNNSSKVSRLSERLLTYLVKAPDMWPEVDVQVRETLLEAVADMGLLGAVMGFLDANPEADTEEMLVHWSDNEAGRVILNAAQKNLEIDRQGMRAEFLDGIDRLLDHLRSADRRRILDQLRDSSDVEDLRRYWQLHGLGKDIT